jgi:hypothetical protein
MLTPLAGVPLFWPGGKNRGSQYNFGDSDVWRAGAGLPAHKTRVREVSQADKPFDSGKTRRRFFVAW